jgi:hypothetical protein
MAALARLYNECDAIVGPVVPISEFSRIGADEHQPAAVGGNGIDRIGLLRNRERSRIERSAGVQELDPDTLSTPRKCHDDTVMTGFRAGVLDRIGEQFSDAETRDEKPRIYARTPVFQLPRVLAGEDRTLLIWRTGRARERRKIERQEIKRQEIERHEIKIDDSIVAAGFYDLANANVSLGRGAIYDARIGRHRMTFQVDAKAKSAPAPVVSRLLRFQ